MKEAEEHLRTLGKHPVEAYKQQESGQSDETLQTSKQAQMRILEQQHKVDRLRWESEPKKDALRRKMHDVLEILGQTRSNRISAW